MHSLQAGGGGQKVSLTFPHPEHFPLPPHMHSLQPTPPLHSLKAGVTPLGGRGGKGQDSLTRQSRVPRAGIPNTGIYAVKW
jgi:hypothetical protein